MLQSQAMARLAAAHRYAVRTIQAFVTNLPNTDLHSGLPSSYHELALLIRQMSLLSTEMSTDGKSSVQEDLVKMLDRVDVRKKEYFNIINILSSMKSFMVDYHTRKKYHPRQKSRVIFFQSFVIYHNIRH
jgi:hypothetical protein